MNKEEIENRILICEIKEREYREADNTKTANRYLIEKKQWEELLYKLNPKRDEELREYKIGYNNLKQALNKMKDKLLCYGETFDSDIHKQFQKECLEIIDKALGGNDGNNKDL